MVRRRTQVCPMGGGSSPAQPGVLHSMRSSGQRVSMVQLREPPEKFRSVPVMMYSFSFFFSAKGWNEGNESSVKPKNSFRVPESCVTRSHTRMPAGVEKLNAYMWL